MAVCLTNLTLTPKVRIQTVIWVKVLSKHMTPYLATDEGDLYLGDNIEILRELPEQSVQTVMTSPPYWGLRDYGTADWEGGDEDCEHTITHDNDAKNPDADRPFRGDRSKCLKCDAKRVDLQVGLENTPEAYIESLVELFREVRRVLKDDGTVWLNLGDTYWGGKGKSGMIDSSLQAKRTNTLNKSHHNDTGGKGKTRPQDYKHTTFKPKDLCLMPHRVAIALQEDGWLVRNDIIWEKPNCMPSSAKDRLTVSHEYIFLLAKQKKYYYDQDAVREPYTTPMNRWGGTTLKADGESTWDEGTGQSTYRNRSMRPNPKGRNRRTVWKIPTKSYKGAHFAVFPEALVEPCVLAGAPEGGIVLDPFVGSGTVPLVAIKNNRKFIGIDLNEEYLKLAVKRLEDSKPLLDAKV